MPTDPSHLDKSSSTQPSESMGPPTDHPFPCNLCGVAFRNSELQRAHKRSDWHVYNAKRQQEDLPSVSSEVFAEKVLVARASSAAAAAKASFERFCRACQRTYYSENAYQNHLGSQKHRLKLAHKPHDGAAAVDDTGSMVSSTFSLGEPIAYQNQNLASKDEDAEDVEAEFSDVVNKLKETTVDDKEPATRRPTRPHHSGAEIRAEHPLSQTTTPSATPSSNVDGVETPQDTLPICMFCSYRSPTLDLNVGHMQKIHGMFIPEQAYLVDKAGLIQYLHQKIFDDHQCLTCGNLRTTTYGVQTHMRDKSHCRIPFDTEVEMLKIGQFYDFSSTYSDDEEKDEEGHSHLHSSRAKLGMKRSVIIEATVDGVENKEQPKSDGIVDGDGWETDTSASSVDTEDLTSIPVDHEHLYEKLHNNPHHCHRDFRPRHARDGWHARTKLRPRAVYYDDYELHLPSGRSVGHRSLNRYYRQNLHNFRNSDSDSEIESSRHQRTIGDVSAGEIDPEDQPIGEERGRQVATRSGNELGMVGVSDGKKREIKAVEKRERRREQRERRRYDMGVSKRFNSQKHFRDPLLQ
ncbi:MAG: hypothetical protein M1833_006347 [Piccolia ochrophora]|nr:MAG: hypothetical protein M1833_006347 [Piccolia ochrophora]